MNIKGFCMLKSTQTVRGYAGNAAELLGTPLAIFDVAVNGDGFLVFNKEMTALADVRMPDVDLYFLCEIVNGVVIPPNLSFEQKMAEVAKRIGRKGGYNNIIKNMVIAGSLAKGKFDDRFLFD